MKNDILKRPGKFLVSEHLIRNNPDMVMKLLGNVLIVRVERLYFNDTVEYQGYSELFDVVEEGSFIHNYDITYDGTEKRFIAEKQKPYADNTKLDSKEGLIAGFKAV
ncbi:MAG: hypothetical protein QNK20_04175 [Aureibaculum sp.]|nr:hypothetical protein [Aureibaculum sp.]